MGKLIKCDYDNTGNITCVTINNGGKDVEYEPVRHGEWKWVFNRKADTKWGKDAYENGWECSECGGGATVYISYEKVSESMEKQEMAITDERTPYCHMCGARMDGGLPHNVGQATGGAEDA